MAESPQDSGQGKPMDWKRIIDVAYAALYFSALSFLGAYFVPAICAGRCEPEVLSAAGLALALGAVLLITFTRFLLNCVFIAVIGLSMDIAGLRAQPFDPEIAWSFVFAFAMLTGVVVLANVKAYRAPLWAGPDFRIH
ncbi:hypothetical protein K8R03_02465 [Candidatus Kaiserbacteria bacterium]|nr:hypothetical protein [Candidatus Kaiserbacteria bacterium]